MCRQWLSDTMTSRTIDLARKLINEGHKVVIFCSFDSELYKIQEAFKDECVIHNGKLNGIKNRNLLTAFKMTQT